MTPSLAVCVEKSNRALDSLILEHPVLGVQLAPHVLPTVLQCHLSSGA